MSKLTRESAKSSIRSKVTVATGHVHSLKHSDDVIDQIFDQHEDETAQLRMENDELRKLVDDNNTSKSLKRTGVGEYVVWDYGDKEKHIESLERQLKEKDEETKLLQERIRELEKQNDIIATKHKNQVEGNKHLRKQLGGEVVGSYTIDEICDEYIIEDYGLCKNYTVLVIKQKGE